MIAPFNGVLIYSFAAIFNFTEGPVFVKGRDDGLAIAVENNAIRSIGFVVPNSVGVQEGAYILLGGAFGLSPEMGLALSLLKRARDLTIGLPVIALWQAIEGGRLWRRVTTKPTVEPVASRD